MEASDLNFDSIHVANFVGKVRLISLEELECLRSVLKDTFASLISICVRSKDLPHNNLVVSL